MIATIVPTTRPKRGCRYYRNLVLLIPLAMLMAHQIFALYSGYVGVDEVLYPKRSVFCCDTPADAGIAYRDVELITQDNLKLAAWYLLPADELQPTIIMAHGASGNRINLWNIAAALQAKGFGILLLEMRAHGASEGTIFTRGWLDIQAAAEYLTAEGVNAIGAYGFSLGANMVIQAAAQSNQIDAVVADGASPVVLSDMPLPVTLAGWLYLGYDVMYWTQLEARSAPAGGFAAIPMREAVSRLAGRPLLLIAAGAESSGFERSVAQNLYEAVAEPKVLWVIEDVYHGGGFDADPVGFIERIAAFFAPLRGSPSSFVPDWLAAG